MVNRFILNEVSYFGPGARRELPGVVARFGFKKALVVTDKGLMQCGVAKMVLDVMDEAGITLEDIHRELASRHVIDKKVKQEKMV